MFVFYFSTVLTEGKGKRRALSSPFETLSGPLAVRNSQSCSLGVSLRVKMLESLQSSTYREPAQRLVCWGDGVEGSGTEAVLGADAENRFAQKIPIDLKVLNVFCMLTTER